ncbi:MAG: helix-turn-helix transcriptional regulator, partial [Saccharothrix sp.]|nr:helix-turn-helix transcriptional regulator [Saccharothrix sp.]
MRKSCDRRPTRPRAEHFLGTPDPGNVGTPCDARPGGRRPRPARWELPAHTAARDLGWPTVSELSEFLRSRRGRLSPEQAGLATYGTRRRVPGLRREELAQLAGISADYYIRFEQGRLDNVS